MSPPIPQSPRDMADFTARKRARYFESRRRNDAARMAAKLIADHPDEFPPGHPLRKRILGGGAGR